MLSPKVMMELKQRRDRRRGIPGAVSALAKEYHISRQTIYNACQRLEEGLNGHRGRRSRAQQRRLQKEIRRLEDELRFTQEYLRLIEAGPLGSPHALEDFVLVCAVRGVTLRGIVEVVWAAFRLKRSHSWAKEIIDRASQKAQAVFERLRPWRNASQIVADEIFLGKLPLLVAAEPQSLAVLRLSVEKHRDAAAWSRLFEGFEGVKTVASDLGKGLLTAIAAWPWAHQPDLFHALKILYESMRKWERRCYRKIREEYEWEEKWKQRRRKGKKCSGQRMQHHRARKKTDQALIRFDEAERVVRHMWQAVQIVDPTGRWIPLEERQRTIENGLRKLESLGIPHPKKVKGYWAHENFLTFARTVEEAFAQIPIDVEELSRKEVLDAAAAVWARKKGTVRGRRALVATLRALTAKRACSNFGEVCEQVGTILGRILRASSAIECLNSMWRVVQQVKKSFGTKFAYLVALHHNMKPFTEGPRKGRTPFELLGVSLPTNNWLELLRQ